jgi:hypothetical protein
LLSLIEESMNIKCLHIFVHYIWYMIYYILYIIYCILYIVPMMRKSKWAKIKTLSRSDSKVHSENFLELRMLPRIMSGWNPLCVSLENCQRNSWCSYLYYQMMDSISKPNVSIWFQNCEFQIWHRIMLPRIKIVFRCKRTKCRFYDFCIAVDQSPSHQFLTAIVFLIHNESFRATNFSWLLIIMCFTKKFRLYHG